MAGDVSAIPTVSDGVVYVPDWGVPLLGGGKLHAIDASTGRAIWSKSMIEYTHNALNTVSRSSPAIAGDLTLLSLVGIQFISMGLLGEVMTRTYFESQGKPPYVISDSRNLPGTDENKRAA